MAEKILFPDDPPASWVSDHKYISFTAVRGPRKFSCLVTSDFLNERFGLRMPLEEEAMRLYEMHRSRIQAVARAEILAGSATDENHVLITTETFAFNKITFSDAIRESPDNFRMVRQATAELEEVLGESAPVTTVEWSLTKDVRDRTLYVLVIRDFVAEVSVAFTPDQLERPRDVRSRLYHAWGDLLQDRNHKQLRELLGAGQSGE